MITPSQLRYVGYYNEILQGSRGLNKAFLASFPKNRVITVSIA